MEDIEEKSEKRRNAIDIYKLYKLALIHKSYQEKLETVTHMFSDSTTVKLEALKKEFKETEDDLKYLSFTCAERVGEIVKPLDKKRFLVKGYDGRRRYIVNCCNKVDQSKLVSGTRVTQEKQSLTIMRILPPMINPLVYNMVHRHSEDVSYSDLGGLSKQIRDLREYIELPLTNPEIFQRVGVKLPKGVLLYGPPGTGKTLLARAIASNMDSTFLTVVSSALVSRYLGDSSLLVREMFRYARDHQPCIIFMDEIDAIGRRRGSSEKEVRTSECDRVLMELLSQFDGFNELDKVKVIMATNRPDVLDPALLRPGRIDKKIEIPLPNGDSRMRILKIHASGISKHGEIDYEKVVKLSEGFNGADMRNICTEAGMLALRAKRDYVVPNDFIKAVTKLGGAKKLESSAQYNADF